MSNVPKTASSIRKIASKHGISEYRLQNGLTVLFAERTGTGVVTSDIVYRVGSRDEARGETGIAHMLEHMLFKPTKSDQKHKHDAGAMRFEREVGVHLNANTWKDRTSYFFSYPKEHIDRALQIEADRMYNVTLTEEEFTPERGNVLSEFDMYNGDEEFALAQQVTATAIQAHPYGHETIGYREDIEAYTPEKLDRFYKKFYTTQNAILIIVGDVREREMKQLVLKHFGHLTPSKTYTPRVHFVEPKQEGVRSVTVERPSTKQMFALGIKTPAFPTRAWFETMVAFEMLAHGDDSVLHRALVDTGLASNVHGVLDPMCEPHVSMLFVTLTEKLSHDNAHKKITSIISALNTKTIAPYLKKTIARTLTAEAMTRENSLGFVSELVEYVSAGSWEAFFTSEETLKRITPADIKRRLEILFAPQQLTLGYFIGTKKQ